MKTYKLEAVWGGTIFKVADRAKEIAKRKDVVVEFVFNEVICLVNKNSDTNLLYRDYLNSWLMGWKIIGPNYLKQYSHEIQEEFERKTAEKEVKDSIEREKSKVKELKERDSVLIKTADVKLSLTNSTSWDSGKTNNQDEYGSAVYEYAESWAKLMQAEMANGASLADCAGRTSFELGYLGITGFMYGASVSILSGCWEHGEELRKWHNKDYNHDGDGIVNPAIITLSNI